MHNGLKSRHVTSGLSGIPEQNALKELSMLNMLEQKKG
jgi:hypothetical protein